MEKNIGKSLEAFSVKIFYLFFCTGILFFSNFHCKFN